MLVFANLDDHCSAENLRDFIENADDCGGVIRVQDVNVATKKTKKAAVGSERQRRGDISALQIPGPALAWTLSVNGAQEPSSSRAPF